MISKIVSTKHRTDRNIIYFLVIVVLFITRYEMENKIILRTV